MTENNENHEWFSRYEVASYMEDVFGIPWKHRSRKKYKVFQRALFRHLIAGKPGVTNSFKEWKANKNNKPL